MTCRSSVCMWERMEERGMKKQKEEKGEKERVWESACVCVCVCVCKRERDKWDTHDIQLVTILYTCTCTCMPTNWNPADVSVSTQLSTGTSCWPLLDPTLITKVCGRLQNQTEEYRIEEKDWYHEEDILSGQNGSVLPLLGVWEGSTMLASSPGPLSQLINVARRIPLILSATMMSWESGPGVQRSGCLWQLCGTPS